MALSLSKLNKLFINNNFLPKKYYKLYGICLFIEVISLENAQKFLVYISSKYEISLENSENIYKVKIIETDQSENIADTYGGSPNPFELEKKYEEIELESDNIDPNDNILEKITKNYKKTINIDNTDNTKDHKLNCIHRQLDRLKYCVQNLSYKIAIIYGRYIALLHLDESIECFFVKRLPESGSMELLVTVTLEVFFDSIDNINTDIKNIKNGIERIVDRSQEKHIKSFSRIIEKNNNLLSSFSDIYNKKQIYIDQINKLEELLSDINSCESRELGKMNSLTQKQRVNTTISKDISFTHEKNRIYTALSGITRVKKDIIDNIIKLRNINDNTYLFIDKVLFDNIIMLDRIFKNLELLVRI